MHMADALLSPTVGITMAAVSIGAMAYSVKKIAKDETFDEKKIPIMAVTGAFIFAAQMINFTIPGTGASGHIGGGVLLAAMLGPYPALLTMSAVLMIQCLFFADGGLLALGANIFNLGVIVSLVIYPLVYKPIVKKGLSRKRITLASILAVVAGLQLGSLGVVLETILSNITEMPFSTFLLLMQPIHLAIGIVEGVVTAAVLNFIYSMRPEILEGVVQERRKESRSLKKVLVIMILLTLTLGGGISLYASSNPDGLEWSLERVTGTQELEAVGESYQAASRIQDFFAFMPDYANKQDPEEGTSAAGILGGLITLGVAGVTGWSISRYKKRKRTDR